MLHRSNTDSGIRRSKTRSIDSQAGNQILEHIPRRPSPLKRHSQASLSSIPEATRTSRTRTRLVVDESGTARTETFTDDDMDQTYGRSFSRWDDDESSDEEAIITSQRNSFVFSSNIMRPVKHSRDDEFDFMGQFKRPLSSASIGSLSSNSGGNLQTQQQTGGVEDQSTGNHMDNFHDVNKTIHGRLSSDQDERGDAQDALRRLVGGRFRRGSNFLIIASLV
jgi:hypothetical protein